MGNSAVGHCRFPVLGNISGQFFQNHRWLIIPDPVSEPPPGLQIDHLCDGFDPGIQILMPPQKRATTGDSRDRSDGNTFRTSDSQIFDLILKSPCRSSVDGVFGIKFGSNKFQGSTFGSGSREYRVR